MRAFGEKLSPLTRAEVLRGAIVAAVITAGLVITAVVTDQSHLVRSGSIRAAVAIDIFVFAFTIVVSVYVTRQRAYVPLWGNAPLAVAVAYSFITLAPRDAVTTLQGRVYQVNGFTMLLLLATAALWGVFLLLGAVRAANGAVWTELGGAIAIVVTAWAWRTDAFPRAYDLALILGPLLGLIADSHFDRRLREPAGQ